MLILGGSPVTPITLGLGVFDGVHLGHQKIVALSDALLTFMPHPDQVLGKNKGLKYLTTLREQRMLVPHLLGLRFTRAIAALPYEVFLDRLCSQLPVKAIVVGEDFCCGQGRQGTPERLVSWGQAQGRPVHVEPLHAYRGQAVKSSDIRQLILNGGLREAAALLGHPYLISGRVVAGQGVGRRLGFPTANLQIPRYKLLLPPGVYGGYCVRDGQRLPSLLYIGYRPTFGMTRLSVEVHILSPDAGGIARGLGGGIPPKALSTEALESASPQNNWSSAGLGSASPQKALPTGDLGVSPQNNWPSGGLGGASLQNNQQQGTGLCPVPCLNLYGEYLAMHVCDPIRGDMRFDSPDALVRQIKKDREVVRHAGYV
jgi:riboflavin kinase/FMN adenylyltransferase